MSETNDNSSTHVILLAHGSRDSHWTDTFDSLYERLKNDVDHRRVKLAFMELAEPSLETALNSARESGAERIEILPLFFAAGKHLREDVPNMLEAYRRVHPSVQVELLNPVGKQEAFTHAMIQIITNIIGSSTP